MKYILLCILFALCLVAKELITPIPTNIKYNQQKANIGKMLFFDTILSKDRKISCASCHKPNNGWADKKDFSVGIFGAKDIVQTPTILNSTFNFRQFWNGKAKNFKEQIDITLHNPIEMGMTKILVEKRVNQSREYKDIFLKVYHKDFISYKMVIDTIIEFQKALTTPNAKFDLFLQNKAKLTTKERQGYRLFKKLGCITCHNGVNIGGNSFQKIGLIFKYNNCEADRYQLTKKEFDRCVYKVPTLRNIELTAPYFHDASAKTLKKAIEYMAHYNLGYIIKDSEIESIESFLKTLTGKIQNTMSTSNGK